jgi:hypothetical protein
MKYNCPLGLYLSLRNSFTKMLLGFGGQGGEWREKT